jgi:hypothetical protein
MKMKNEEMTGVRGTRATKHATPPSTPTPSTPAPKTNTLLCNGGFRR